jgi:hypothetical protein
MMVFQKHQFLQAKTMQFHQEFCKECHLLLLEMAYPLVRIGAAQATCHHQVLHLLLLVTLEMAKVHVAHLHFLEGLG